MSTRSVRTKLRSLWVVMAWLAAGALGAAGTAPGTDVAPGASEELKGLSLHLKGQSLMQVADALQRQVGEERQVSAMGLVGGVYTVEKDNLTWSELVAELDRQSAVTLALSRRKVAAGEGKGAADVFLIKMELLDDPNLFSQPELVMRVDVPRRGIIQRSRGSEMTKAIDQDGRALPLSTVRLSGADFSQIIRPVNQATVMAAMEGKMDVLQVKAFKTMEGTLEFGLLEKEAVQVIDLQKPLVPVKTAQGTFTVTVEGGAITVAFEPPAPLTADTYVVATREDFLAGRFPAEPLSSIPVRVYDKQHKLLVEGASGVMGGAITASRARPPAGVGRRRGDPIVPLKLSVAMDAAATLEISLPEAMRPVTMGFRLHDVPVVATVTPKRAGGP